MLVPGELLPLHIFEERYKAMMNDAVETERQFGLSFVPEAVPGTDTTPAVGSVGCVAQITAIVPLPEGRMNLLAIGAGRYVVRGYAQHEPYLVAEVDMISDRPSDDAAVASLAEDVRTHFTRLAVAARALSSEPDNGSTPDVDVPPEPLSFLVAANIALENEVKQRMLEATDTWHRLDQIYVRLRELVEIYEYRASIHARSKSNGHGKKLPPLVN